MSIFIGGTGTANELNDYEVGSFIPTLHRAGTDPSSAGYYTRAGRYTKIGNLVHVQVTVDAHSVSGGSGQWNVANFPFATENNSATGWSNTWVAGRMYFDGDYAMGVDGMTLRTNHNKTAWYLYNQDDDTAVTSNATRIIFQGHVTYRTDT